MHDDDQPIEDRLAKLWRDGAREIGIAFLKRALHPDMTLAELEAALHFEGVQEQLAAIRLRDVLEPPARQRPAAATAAPHAAAVAPRGRKKKTAGKRRRRNSQQTEQMRETVAGALQGNREGLTTPVLVERLKKAGLKVEAPVATQVLRAMEAEGQIAGDSGRPKTWRWKHQGRQVPEPVIIRKARAEEPDND